MAYVTNMRNFLLSLLSFSLAIPAIAQLSPWDAVPLMQKGINLGNTLEPPQEGGWNNPAAQEYYFDLYKEAGFKTVRIPIRWDEHTAETSPYAITESWMQRVEQIVDWALERDLFVVINSHHDNWIKETYGSPVIRARFDSIWSQISVRFKDKSERLLFEVLNEPYGLTKTQNDDMHARILSIIRKTNPTRIVIFQGHNWGGSDELLTAAVPDDNFIMGSFHSYDPYLFGLEGQGTWGTSGDYLTLENKFKAVKNWSDIHNIPVFLGEFGSLRSCDYNSRMKHYRAYVELSLKYGFISCAWDDGGDFRIMERAAHKWDEVKDILIYTSSSAPQLNLKIVQGTQVQVSWNNSLSADSIFIEYRTPTGSFNRVASLYSDSVSWLHSGRTEEVYHHYRVIALYNNGEQKYSQPQRIFVPEYIPQVRGYFLGSPLDVPGTIEVEDFDTGGEGLSWHEASITNIGGAYRVTESVDIYSFASGGYYISNVWPGEWFEHTINVETEGDYIVSFLVASKQEGGTFQLKAAASLSDTILVPSTQSSVVTTTVSDTLFLEAGIQLIRFTIIDIPYFSIDKMIFSRVPIITGFENPAEGDFNMIQFNDQLTIELTESTNVEIIQLFDSNGRLLKTFIEPELTMHIPLSDFAHGLYIIKVTSKSGSMTRKFINAP
jgi:hypothetical protein